MKKLYYLYFLSKEFNKETYHQNEESYVLVSDGKKSHINYVSEIPKAINTLRIVSSTRLVKLRSQPLLATFSSYENLVENYPELFL